MQAVHAAAAGGCGTDLDAVGLQVKPNVLRLGAARCHCQRALRRTVTSVITGCCRRTTSPTIKQEICHLKPLNDQTHLQHVGNSLAQLAKAADDYCLHALLQHHWRAAVT